MINPRFIGILAGGWLGLAWAIGIGDAFVVLVLAAAGYAVALLVTRRGGRDADSVSWRWPRTREARTEERRRREARREAVSRLEHSVPGERASGDGSRRNGVRQTAH